MSSIPPGGSVARGEQYSELTRQGLDPDAAAANLVERMQDSIMLLESMENDVMTINNDANALGIPWSPNVESLLAHLSIDLRYLRAELSRILNGTASR